MDANDTLLDYFPVLYPHQDFADKLGDLRRDVAESFKDAAHIHVLDLCCAQGRALSALRSIRNVRLVGLDNNERMIAAARREVSDATFMLGDVRALPELFGPRSFHCVTITSGSIQFFDRATRAKIFRDVRDLLVSDGGMFVADVFRPSLEGDADRAWVRKWIKTSDSSTLIVFCREAAGASNVQTVYVVTDTKDGYATVTSGSTQYFDLTREQLIEELESHFPLVTAFTTDYPGTDFVVARTTEVRCSAPRNG